jgi:hypothetical protein
MRALLIAALLVQAITSTPAHASGVARNTYVSSNTTDLEHSFWVCDYAGTNTVVDPNQGAACIAITDELKRVKFDGDFDRLVVWWRVHKIARHQEFDRALAAAPQNKLASDAL